MLKNVLIEVSPQSVGMISVESGDPLKYFMGPLCSYESHFTFNSSFHDPSHEEQHVSDSTTLH